MERSNNDPPDYCEYLVSKHMLSSRVDPPPAGSPTLCPFQWSDPRPKMRQPTLGCVWSLTAPKKTEKKGWVTRTNRGEAVGESVQHGIPLGRAWSLLAEPQNIAPPAPHMMYATDSSCIT
jgi:hypothetical protein